MPDPNAHATSLRAAADTAPDTDPASPFWRAAPALAFATDIHGHPRPEARTTVRSRWTAQHLYLLFACAYTTLQLRPDPCLHAETNQLWYTDVAEIFLAVDPAHPRRYYEFQVSPQGEWVDLQVDLDIGPPEDGWLWQSGLTAAARIDAAGHYWYGFLKIPFAALGIRPIPGLALRANLLRCEGQEPERLYLAWRPTHCDTFHVPERFGLFTLVD